MKEYEIVKEVFNPCAADQRRDTCETIEKEVENPEAFVKEQYRQESHVEFLASEKDGSLIVEVLFDSGRKHRYTFTEL